MESYLKKHEETRQTVRLFGFKCQLSEDYPSMAV